MKNVGSVVKYPKSMVTKDNAKQIVNNDDKEGRSRVQLDNHETEQVKHE